MSRAFAEFPLPSSSQIWGSVSCGSPGSRGYAKSVVGLCEMQGLLDTDSKCGGADSSGVVSV